MFRFGICFILTCVEDCSTRDAIFATAQTNFEAGY